MSYQYVINISLLVLAVYSATHALIYKKDSRAAFGWIAVCLIFPFFGPLLYFIFGVNRVRTRAQKLRASSLNNQPNKSNKFVASDLENKIPESLINIHRVSSRITELPLIGGNYIENLYSGEQTYAAMLGAIKSAKHYIYLCVYIFKRDNIGQQFIQALMDANNRGVDVYVLVDGIGEFYSWKKVRHTLPKQNIQVRRFLPPKLIPFNLSINLRNHRKLLVIDDEISFIGGTNIADEYFQNAVKRP